VLLVRSLTVLVGGALAAWLLAAVPARWLGGDEALLLSGVAFLLCLVPTALTLAWCHTALGGSPEQQLLAVLGGSGVRMLFVIAAALVLFHTTEVFHRRGFLLWVIAAYLVTLTLEVVLVARRQTRLERPEPPNPTT
jgi:hypothetical protein